MCSAFLRLALAATVLAAAPATARELRFCAEPNNLPFSDSAGTGFENRVARLVAAELGAEPVFVWEPQWRGFLRKGLNAGRCDVVGGVPVGLERVRTTRPYYRSTYAFVQRAADPQIGSFDAPALRAARIGVQLIGDDGVNTPPVDELGRRGLGANLRGFMVHGDFSRPNPLAPIVEAVAAGEIDVAVVWGPEAGYLAALQPVPLRVTPVREDSGGAAPAMSFAIAMGVRKADAALAAELDRALERRRPEIEAVLDGFWVPRTEEVDVSFSAEPAP